jgi:hypothetical protein
MEDGARSSDRAIVRQESPAANPRETSSRSVNDNRRSDQTVGASGRVPSIFFTRSCTAPWDRPMALAITFIASPRSHRSQTSECSAALNRV